MNISEVIFTSYCFGNDYRKQQERLAYSIRGIYRDARLHFVHEMEVVGKDKFQQSLYGFKVHMIKQCIEFGFKKIIYFDTAICLHKRVDQWFQLTQKHGFLAAIDNQMLSAVTSNNCLRYLNLKREQVSSYNLCGGSLYILDMDVTLCREIWNTWSQMEAVGLFGTQDDLSYDRLQSHRMDETCLGLSFMLHGVKPLTHNEIGYAYEHPETKKLVGSKDPIVIKRHFK